MSLAMENGLVEAYKLEGYVDWRRRPVDKSKQGGFRSASVVLVSEVFENLAFIAIATNLVNYFLENMHYSRPTASIMVTNFMGTCFLLPLLGGFICDTYITTYFTVITFAIVELIGLLILTIQARYPSLQPLPCNVPNPSKPRNCKKVEGLQAAMLYVGLYLVALGVGGVKGSLPVHGAEQFDENDPKERKLRSNFFNWFLFSMCTGSLLGVTFVVWIQDNKGWQWGFAIPTISCALVAVVFVLGTRNYRNKLPQGSPLTRMTQVIVAAIIKRRMRRPSQVQVSGDKAESPAATATQSERSHLLRRTPQFRFLDKASVREPGIGGQESPWRLCSVSRVEEVKIMMRVVPIFFSTIMMNCCLAQLQTYSNGQAKTMDRRIKGFQIPAASLPAIPVISMMLLIPLYDMVFVPLVGNITGKETGITHLQRVGVGLLLSILSMAVAALVEIKRKGVAIQHGLVDSRDPLPITFMWVGFQYFLLGIADMFVMVGLMEFFYSEAPSSMKSLATALSWATISMGYFLSSVLVKIVNSLSKQVGDRSGWLAGNNLNRCHLDYFYWLLCLLSALNFIQYIVWSLWYRYRIQSN